MKKILLILILVMIFTSLIHAKSNISIFERNQIGKINISLTKDFENQHYTPLKDGYYFSLMHPYFTFKDLFKYEETLYHNLFSYKTYNEQNWIKLQFAANLEFNKNKNDSYFFASKGYNLYGKYQNIRFESLFWAGQFTGDRNYYLNSEQVDSWIKSGETLFFDNIATNIEIETENFGTYYFGRDTHEIGNNISGSIILSDGQNEYGYFGGKWKLGRIELDFLHGSLVADSTSSTSNNTLFDDKFVSIHQIKYEFQKLPLNVFLGESVIYGARSIDVNYLIPLNFHRATEHNLYDRDNVLIFSGLNYQSKKLGLIYFNFLLDELRKSEIFSDWWGNKYAGQIGIFKEFPDYQIGAEFTFVRPWMYTHKDMINKYSHDDRALGYSKGSNLIDYSTLFKYTKFQRYQIEQLFSYTRQGSWGNDFTLNYTMVGDIQNATAKWLQGNITDTFTSQTILDWKILAHHKIRLVTRLENINDSFEWDLRIGYQVVY